MRDRSPLLPFAALSACYFAHVGFFIPYLPLWLKELTLAGTLAYGAHGHGGASTSAFAAAAAMIATRRVSLAGLVTHEFTLAEHRRALATARERDGSGSVKVVFKP